jgi:hypothetical protein
MAQPLTDAIQALTRYANETTGASDQTLSDAVETLVEGYGQGGGSWTTEGFISKTEPNGDIVVPSSITRIGAYTFYGRNGITSLVGDGVTDIGTGAFQECSALETVNLPNCTQVDANAFQNCSSLVSVSLPKLITVGGSSFRGCNYLTTLHLPEVTTTSNYSFQAMSRLKYCVLPKVTSIANNAFMSALASMSESNRATFDFGCTTISGFAFNSARYIGELILRSQTMCTLANVNAFSGVNTFHTTGATLYVPQALIADYTADSKWATVLAYNANNQILPIEGSQYEHYYADGTPIE